MNLGEPMREIECAPLQWPQQMPSESAPAHETVPAEIPAETVPAGKE